MLSSAVSGADLTALVDLAKALSAPGAVTTALVHLKNTKQDLDDRAVGLSARENAVTKREAAVIEMEAKAAEVAVEAKTKSVLASTMIETASKMSQDAGVSAATLDGMQVEFREQVAAFNKYVESTKKDLTYAAAEIGKKAAGLDAVREVLDAKMAKLKELAG